MENEILTTTVEPAQSEIVVRPGYTESSVKMLPPNREPLLDIVLLCHSQPKWTDLAVRAVEHHTVNPYRLIIVDSASTLPEMQEVLKAASARGHTVLRLAENRSFSNGVNTGVRAGNSKFICILNDDAIVTEGWDSAMLQDASAKFTGLVGARSNYASGAQGDPSFVGKPPYLVFVCVALRREIWDIVGPMDEETFDGFSSEDIDYSWRVVKAGYELKVSGAYVLHAGSRTLASTTGSAEGIARVNRKYNDRLVEKWGKEWAAEHSKLRGRVLIGSYSAEEWTRVSFMGALCGLKRSDGIGFSYHNMTRLPIHMARHALTDYAYDQGFDYLIQLDDDATFPPDLLRRLLSHQKELVCALAYQRRHPYGICAYEQSTEDKLLGNPLQNIEHTGLKKVDVSGLHVSCLKLSVVKKLRDAGIRQYYGGFDNKLGEDFAFCVNLRNVGVPIYVDTELISGHLGQSIEVNENFKQKFNAGQFDGVF